MTTNKLNNSSSSLTVSSVAFSGSTITTLSNSNLNLIPDSGSNVVISGSYSLPNVDGSALQVLSTDGAGNGIFGPRNGYSINVQVFTTSGIYTPSPRLQYCEVECISGGGGGGGSLTTSSTEISNGGGGGSGAYCKKLFTSATIGASQTVTIGSGGAGGIVSSGVRGGTGGTTTFGSLLTATGGTGGECGTGIPNAAAGVGGTASGGDINLDGSQGRVGTGIFYATGTSVSSGGAGASSYYGSGNYETQGLSGSGSGVSGLGVGSGGTGAYSCSSSTGQIGGSGISGIVICTEYIL
jgi:hypothetical protein